MKPLDPRVSPMRRIYRRVIDEHGRWALLDCGDVQAVTDTAGQGERMRCDSCKARLRRAIRGLPS